jgi:D-hydroxyproline dehydrogenase subunit beta
VDVLVVGAGIVGCTAAALLAEAGAEVTVLDRAGVAAGASGRNSGVLQHPLDPALGALHAETLTLQRQVLELPADPDGILLLGATSAEGLPPELHAEVLEDAHAAEPAVRRGIPAVRVATGHVVGPRAATEAWAARARAAGARFARGEWREGRALAGGRALAPARVLLATGAWTPGIAPLWGVTVRISVRSAHVLEDAGAVAAVDGAGGEAFTLCGDVLGSSASPAEPDPGAVARRLAGLATPFVGPVDLTGAPRACPRPHSPDGLPLVGRVGERTWVCAGHGAWGISIGPATARMAVDALLGRGDPPAGLDPSRRPPAADVADRPAEERR